MEYEYIKLDKENIFGLSLLVNFTSLSRLVIYSYSTSNLSLTDILNNCPNIVSLDFSSYYAVPDSVYNLETNMKQTKLKNLELAIPTLTKSCMNYLSRCLILDKLETFNINLTEEEIYGMLNREGIDNVLKMARQLSSVKNIKLYANPENDGTFELPNPEDRMTILYSLIHALQGNRVMNCFATYSDIKPLEFSISVSNGEKLNFLYGISQSDYTPDYENRSLFIDELPMPDKNVSIIGPDIINKLLFIMINPTEIFTPDLLRYVVLDCPHASSLTITSWNNYSSYEVEAEKDTTKIVLKASIMPSQEVLDLLSAFLPEAKKFKIETPRGCDLFVASKFTIDFTRFRFLEKLTINIHNNHHTAQIAFVSMRFADDDTINDYEITPVNGPNSGFKLLPVNEREYSNSSNGSLIIYLHRIETVKFKSELPRKLIATFRFGELISTR
ncbi:hypothetical protein INT47_009665 [Mucor saturninus]|uniref:Uncharacterized protein n=1 Tax=Mucor saturninus TaxID=64648 RepID=A0A8H7QQQ5_9FUNG|nr:hypothetical protein INT47_009665 [Mucor saturninus]